MTEFVDSFGIYVLITGVDGGPSATSLRNRWNSTGIGSGCYVQANKGARGNPALVLPFGAALARTFTHQATYIQGMRLNISGTGVVGGGTSFQFANNGLILLSLKIGADGSITVIGNNTGATVVCSCPPIIVAATNCYLEISATLTSISSGADMNLAAQVWVNGVSQCSGNVNLGRAVNTLTSRTATFNQIFLLDGVGTNGQSYVSDYYLNNGSGTTNTSVFGPVEIDAFPFPNGDLSIQWTPLGGIGTNFSEINENPADGDVSYVSSSTIGNKDSYAWQDIASFAGTVKSVQLSYFARANDEGIRVFQGNIGTGGTEEQTTNFGLGFSYQYFHQAFDLDPATGLAWTTIGFNAKPFGIKLVA